MDGNDSGTHHHQIILHDYCTHSSCYSCAFIRMEDKKITKRQLLNRNFAQMAKNL